MILDRCPACAELGHSSCVVGLRAQIAAEIEAFADDHSDVSDAYRHAALIAKGTPGP